MNAKKPEPKGSLPVFGEPLRRWRPGTVVTASGNSRMQAKCGQTGFRSGEALVSSTAMREQREWWTGQNRNGASQYSRIMADSGKSRFSPCSSLAPRSPSCTQRRARRANSPANAPPPRFLRHKHLHHVGSLKGGQKRLVAHVVVDHRGRRNLAMRPRRESSACPASACQSGLHFEAERISPPSVRQRENAHSRNRSGGHRHRRDAQWRPTVALRDKTGFYGATSATRS